eukprot:gnl/Dysnectes_brevis/6047_a9091_431.p1 GENE.gnl/Dysnectes_brevis/6047_a9091_431~~gnl/Dysnectes_brevis/6047_a9091_431.p1  ORF type:complete len:269 (-),score=74.27 gnl/Dysnectes_brevis/6047_a9091_431:53-784(-)
MSTQQSVVESDDDGALCSICLTELQDADSEVSLICSHSFHRECILRWLHVDRCTCPNCRAHIDMAPFEGEIWRITNVAVRTRASPASLRLGLRADGWYNIQLQIVPPSGTRLERVRFFFHPAFSLNKLQIDSAPFDLVMKLCSNNVDVLVVCNYNGGQEFTMVHTLVKEVCTRLFFNPSFNGAKDPSKPIRPAKYFEELLPAYRRGQDYYVQEQPAPPRFTARRRQERGSAIQRFFRRFMGAG